MFQLILLYICIRWRLYLQDFFASPPFSVGGPPACPGAVAATSVAIASAGPLITGPADVLALLIESGAPKPARRGCRAGRRALPRSPFGQGKSLRLKGRQAPEPFHLCHRA